MLHFYQKSSRFCRLTDTQKTAMKKVTSDDSSRSGGSSSLHWFNAADIRQRVEQQSTGFSEAEDNKVVGLM